MQFTCVFPISKSCTCRYWDFWMEFKGGNSGFISKIWMATAVRCFTRERERAMKEDWVEFANIQSSRNFPFSVSSSWIIFCRTSRSGIYSQNFGLFELIALIGTNLLRTTFGSNHAGPKVWVRSTIFFNDQRSVLLIRNPDCHVWYPFGSTVAKNIREMVDGTPKSSYT